MQVVVVEIVSSPMCSVTSMDAAPHYCLHHKCNWALTLSKDVWAVVLQGLAFSHQKRDNGIACASRLMHFRWRAYIYPRTISFVRLNYKKHDAIRDHICCDYALTVVNV